MPSLRMLRGPEPGKVFELVGDTITLGRGVKNEIIIRDNQVSREHCRFVRVLYDYELFDLGSTNGTFLNGRQLADIPVPISMPFKIELGETILLEYVPDEMTESTSELAAMADDQPSSAYYLVIRSNQQEEPDVYLLDHPVVTIGRQMDNTIILINKEVSRYHLRFERVDSGYVVEDLGTSNGTFLNGSRIEKSVLLHSDDYLKIGTTIEMWFTHDLDHLVLQPKDHSQDSHANTIPKVPTTFDATSNIMKAIGRIEQPLQTDALRGYTMLAYAREDWPIAEHLYDFLRESGLSPFVDQRYEVDTQQWALAIEQARLECAVLILVLSQRSIDTPHVKGSLQYFMSREKPIIGMSLDEMGRLPLSLQNMSIIPFDPNHPQESFQKIVTALMQLHP